MNFWEGLKPVSFIMWMIRLLIPTGVNVLLINYASSRATDLGDTDWLSAIILIVTMMGSVALFLDAIKNCRRFWVWRNAVNLLVCGFNVYYFFKILMCCVPVSGDL